VPCQDVFNNTTGKERAVEKDVPTHGLTQGESGGTLFTIIFLKHQFPKIEDFEAKSNL